MAKINPCAMLPEFRQIGDAKMVCRYSDVVSGMYIRYWRELADGEIEIMVHKPTCVEGGVETLKRLGAWDKLLPAVQDTIAPKMPTAAKPAAKPTVEPVKEVKPEPTEPATPPEEPRAPKPPKAPKEPKAPKPTKEPKPQKTIKIIKVGDKDLEVKFYPDGSYVMPKPFFCCKCGGKFKANKPDFDKRVIRDAEGDVIKFLKQYRCKACKS